MTNRALLALALAACAHAGGEGAGNGPDAGYSPDSGAPNSDANLGDAAGCAAGMHTCDATCVADGTSCGVQVPEQCPDGDECGSDATCTDGYCVCDAGYRACPSGCCPVVLETTTAAGLYGDDVRLHYAADGTAYLLVASRIYPDTPMDAEQLQLYARPPGGAIATTGWTALVYTYHGAYDFAIRADGTLLIAYQVPASSEIELVTWKAGIASQPVEIGSGYSFDIGISATLDAADTLWVTWSAASESGMTAYSLDTGGTQRTYSLSAIGTVEETDVEYDPGLDQVFAAYGDRYTGTFQSGWSPVTGTTKLASACSADSGAFDRNGHQWTIYNSYTSVDTYTCRDGVSEVASDPRFAGSASSPFENLRIAIDGEDTAFVATYVPGTYTATWYASSDNVAWPSGVVPTHFGLPTEQTSPAQAAIGLARDNYGRMTIVVVPQYASMGDAVLATFTN